MAESEPHSHLAAPGDGDVERLLREAESLTQEVARETGTPVRDADALLSGELSGAPDPLAAVDAASSDVMSLEDLLGDLGSGNAPVELPPVPQASAAVPPIRSTPESLVGAREKRRATGLEKSEPVNIPRPGPRVEHMPPEEPAADGVSEHAAVDPNAHRDTGAKDPSANTPRVTLGRRLMSVGKTGARGLLTAVLIVVRDVPIGVLSFVDIPFRNTPRSIKNAIGIIGAITLGMGALAWALPGLMRPAPAQPVAAASQDAASKAADSGR